MKPKGKGQRLRPTAQAFEKAVEAAYPNLVRAAKALSPRPADANDVVQETLVEAQRAWKSFRGDSSPTTWMYSILVRLASRRRAAAARAPQMEDFAADVPAELPGPQARVETNERAQRVLDAVRRLPARQREVVTLFYMEDLSYEEVARMLGISAGTVKSSMFAAKKTLRTILRPHAGERMAPR